MILSRIRYRFLLVAGVMPYVLGAAAAHYTFGVLSIDRFVLGLIGVVGSLLGVETYNEFFEMRFGADQVFEFGPPPKIPVSAFVLGTFGFAIFVATGAYLATLAGMLVLALAAYGLMAAVFYVGPPIKWAYRGLGEPVIALAYGPFMTIGAYYIQTASVNPQILLVSLIPTFLIFGVVLSNEIPDYYGDKLVAKMNIAVRLGQRRAAIVHRLVVSLAYVALLLSAILGAIPLLALSSLITLPIAIWTLRVSSKHYEYPAEFIKSIRGTVAIYTLMLIMVSAAYFFS